MKQLSGQDNSFLAIEKNGLPQHIASVAIYDQSTAPGGKVRFKDILSNLESRLHLSELFQKKLLDVPMGMDRPYLVDDKSFDIEYHVRHIALPKPGDWRQLCIQLARINARPLDLSRPLWEMYVIEGLNNIDHIPEGSFALLIRIHHCVMDGASGAEMMAAIHDFGPKPRQIEQPPYQVIKAPPTQVALAGRAYLNALKRPRRFMNLGKQIIGAQRRKRKASADEMGHSAERKVLTRFNGEISAHRVLDAVTFDFAELRAIKNTLEGATINDVMLAIVSGALHKFLESVDELPDETLTCGCPIDVRDESEKGTGGNVIGFMGVNLCTEYSDPLERFEAVHEAAVAAKANAQASDVRIPKEVNEALPAGIMTMAMRVTSAMGMNVTPFNTMLTNVPGPVDQLYFAGAQIVEGFGIGPLVPGVGLFHTASSSVQNKEGKLNLSFWACRDMIPQPEIYRQCIVDSFEELRDVTIGKKKPANKRARKVAKLRKPVKSETA